MTPKDKPTIDDLLKPYVEAYYQVNDADNQASAYKYNKWIKEDLQELKAALLSLLEGEAVEAWYPHIKGEILDFAIPLSVVRELFHE